MDVYKAINKAQAMLAKEGIAKNGTNQQQRYPFRKLDDIYNACSRIFSEVGLIIIPNVLEEETKEVATRNGGVSYHTKVKVEWTFVSSHDGSTCLATSREASA